MAQECCKSNPFVRMFIPGLVVGIIVGGLAGAVLPTFIEKWSQPPIVASKPGAGGARPQERDVRPGEPAPEVKTEVKPEEAKPADPKPAEPAPTPKNN